APHLREEDQVEGRRVDGAVVRVEPGLRRLPLADLVDDLARLRVDRRIVLRRLELRQDPERAARELGAEEERLVARDQRVSPEDGHEPRHAGRGELADPGAAPHAQRGEIGDRLEEGAAELVPVGTDLRDAQAPRREGLADARYLVPEP